MSERNYKKLALAYSTKYPCPPELFVGRKAYLDYYKNEVLIPKYKGITPQPPNTAFLGYWGLGKTTLLKYITEAKSMREKGFITIPIVAEFKTIEELLSNTLKSIASSLTKIEWLKAKVEKRLDGIGITPVSLKFKTERTTLVEHLVKTWDIMEKVGVQHCAILIDDFHKLHYNDMFSLRTIFQHLPSMGCNYSLIVSGAPETFSIEHTEPIARFFDKKLMPPFEIDEIEEMMWKPADILKLEIDFENGLEERLEEITRGHPYFLKFFLFELGKREKKILCKHVDKYMTEILSTLGDAKFKNDYNRAAPAQQKILHAAALKNMYQFEAKTMRNIKSYTKHLERLTEKGLLLRTERGAYSIYHPLFMDWIRKFKGGGEIK